MSKKIFVIGSVNIDNTIYTQTLPSPGVTTRGESAFTSFGGKGLNQAFAIYNLGGNVFFYGSVGHDSEGESVKRFLDAKKFNYQFKESKVSTGRAFIMIDKKKENHILVVNGANEDINIKDVDAVDEELKNSDIFLAQLEVPVCTICYLLKRAKEYGLITILNPAPYRKLPDDIFQYIDYLIPNEHELKALVHKHKTTKSRINHLLSLGVKNVIVTLGEDGSTLYTKDKVTHIDAKKVDPIDTTAAGDSYIGALAYALGEDKNIADAMKFATTCSAITVTRKGAISALPKLEEVK